MRGRVRSHRIRVVDGRWLRDSRAAIRLRLVLKQVVRIGPHVPYMVRQYWDGLQRLQALEEEVELCLLRSLHLSELLTQLLQQGLSRGVAARSGWVFLQLSQALSEWLAFGLAEILHSHKRVCSERTLLRRGSACRASVFLCRRRGFLFWLGIGHVVGGGIPNRPTYRALVNVLRGKSYRHTFLGVRREGRTVHSRRGSRSGRGSRSPEVILVGRIAARARFIHGERVREVRRK